VKRPGYAASTGTRSSFGWLLRTAFGPTGGWLAAATSAEMADLIAQAEQAAIVRRARDPVKEKGGGTGVAELGVREPK
jgi:hypothetical protein